MLILKEFLYHLWSFCFWESHKSLIKAMRTLWILLEEDMLMLTKYARVLKGFSVLFLKYLWLTPRNLYLLAIRWQYSYQLDISMLEIKYYQGQIQSSHLIARISRNSQVLDWNDIRGCFTRIPDSSGWYSKELRD